MRGIELHAAAPQMDCVTDIVLDPLRSEAIEAGEAAVLAAWRVSGGDCARTGQTLAQVRIVGELIDVPAPMLAWSSRSSCRPAGASRRATCSPA